MFCLLKSNLRRPVLGRCTSGVENQPRFFATSISHESSGSSALQLTSYSFVETSLVAAMPRLMLFSLFIVQERHDCDLFSPLKCLAFKVLSHSLIVPLPLSSLYSSTAESWEKMEKEGLFPFQFPLEEQNPDESYDPEKKIRVQFLPSTLFPTEISTQALSQNPSRTLRDV